MNLRWESAANIPVNVADVEDLTIVTSLLTRAMELNSDGSPANVGGHGKVGDGGDKGDTGSDVVEETVLARLGGRETHEDDGRGGHGGANSPVPV